MHWRSLELALFMYLFCGVFTSNENSNGISALSSDEHKKTDNGFLEFIMGALQYELKKSDALLKDVQNLIESYLTNKQGKGSALSPDEPKKTDNGFLEFIMGALQYELKKSDALLKDLQKLILSYLTNKQGKGSALSPDKHKKNYSGILKFFVSGLQYKLKKSDAMLKDIQNLIQSYYNKQGISSALSSDEPKEDYRGFVEFIIAALQYELKRGDDILKDIQNMIQSYYENNQGKEAKSKRCSIRSLKSEQRNSKNCAEIKINGDPASGVRTVYPYGNSTDCPIDVFCDQTTDEGGWTVIQSRDIVSMRGHFTRTWDEYVGGFGDPNMEFWLGLENIHALTSSDQMEMRIDLEDENGEKRYAKYGIFHVGDAESKFTLRIGNYSGDAGDGMTHPENEWNLNGMKFSTFDRDNNLLLPIHCSETFLGGWWFNSCHAANLNGFQYFRHRDADGIIWTPFRDYTSLKKTSMKIRPLSNRF